tara:strand:+ start:1061 stop:1402 length:342 start_codon:yes stop_codon:yes gene_type:complete
MKIIKPEDFPVEFTEKNIEILAKMLMAIPPIQKWKEISDLINNSERNIIRAKVKEIKDNEELIRWNSLTLEEQEDEKRKLEESNNDTTSFRGNIFEQERHSIDIENERKKNNS